MRRKWIWTTTPETGLTNTINKLFFYTYLNAAPVGYDSKGHNHRLVVLRMGVIQRRETPRICPPTYHYVLNPALSLHPGYLRSGIGDCSYSCCKLHLREGTEECTDLWSSQHSTKLVNQINESFLPIVKIICCIDKITKFWINTFTLTLWSTYSSNLG